MAILSYDVHCVILDVLKDKSRFDKANLSTIFRYALVCKELAEPALISLYQYSTTILRVTKSTSKGKKHERKLRRCAWMWRSITLSASTENIYLPYCKYIRSFDLSSLTNILSHAKFSDPIYNEFFAGSLFYELTQRDNGEGGSKELKLSKYNLDPRMVANHLCSLIFERASEIRHLEGADYPHLLKAWIGHLPKLHSLHLENGSSLTEDVQEGICVRCPSFKELTLGRWSNYSDSDAEHLFKALSPNSLARFWGPNNRHIPIADAYIKYGPGLISGLNCHFKSITSLRLHDLSVEAIIELSTLRAFEALEDLDVDGDPVSDEFVSPIVRWLCPCKNLRTLSISRFLYDSTALLSQVLVDERIHLESLNVELLICGDKKHNREFYESLASQSSLQTLIIVDFNCSGDAQLAETLVQVLSKLNHLRNLEVPEPLSQVHLRTIVSCLPELQRLDFTGRCESDDIWPLLLGLKNLKILTIYHGTELTARGILDFVLQLGAGNQGFNLCVTEADLSREESAAIKDALKQKVNGNFTE